MTAVADAGGDVFDEFGRYHDLPLDALIDLHVVYGAGHVVLRFGQGRIDGEVNIDREVGADEGFFFEASVVGVEVHAFHGDCRQLFFHST